MTQLRNKTRLSDRGCDLARPGDAFGRRRRPREIASVSAAPRQPLRRWSVAELIAEAVAAHPTPTL